MSIWRAVVCLAVAGALGSIKGGFVFAQEPNQGDQAYVETTSTWAAQDFWVRPDGNQQLLWTNTSGAVSLWILNSSGSLTSSRNFGPYTGWAMTDANDETEARNMLAPSMREKARITKVDIFTPEQIKSYHVKKNA